MAKPTIANLQDFDKLPDAAKTHVGTVAKLYDVSIPTVRRHVERGIIPAPQKLGGSRVWSVGELRQALRYGRP